MSHKTLLISKTLGIEGSKLLKPEDDYEALKEFNVAYEGETSIQEQLHLEYQQLLDQHEGLEERLAGFPRAIFSGRERVSEDAEGVFFCFRLPALDSESGEFALEVGVTRWYLHTLPEARAAGGCSPDRRGDQVSAGHSSSVPCRASAAGHHSGQCAQAHQEHLPEATRRADRSTQALARVLDGAQRRAMTILDPNHLRQITSFEDVIEFLADELDWPIDAGDLEEATFEWNPDELGLPPERAAPRIPSSASPAGDRPAVGDLLPRVRRSPTPAHGSPPAPRQACHQEAHLGLGHLKTWTLDDLLFIITTSTGDTVELHFIAFFEQDDKPTEIRSIPWRPGQSPIQHLKRLATELLPHPRLAR
ncbi:MAG: hypothetical protein M5U19_05545 [Microthrixaceae bacterium]|nr:hypothetical protein [Microthrixaceae bacterium]